MSTSQDQRPSWSHGSLMDSSILDVFVPIDPNVELSRLLTDEHPPAKRSEDSSLVALSLQRDTLFLDEKVDVLLLLRCPFVEEDQFQAFVSRVNLVLEVVAVGTTKSEHGASQNQQPVPLKDLIETKTLDSTEDPLVAVGEDDSDDNGTRPIYVLWKTNVHIARHRMRSSNPSLFFAATLTLKPAPASSSSGENDEYMPSGVPESINLFAPLASDRTFRANPPHLSAARLERVAPTSLTTADSAKPLRNVNRSLIRLVPAVNMRVRFSRVGASSTQAKVLASVDLEVSSQIPELVLDGVDASLSEGRADSLLPPSVLTLPKALAGRDILGLIFNLLPNARQLTTPPPADTSIHTFAATLSATVKHGETPKTIQTTWRSAVDLTSLTRFPLISLSSSTSTPIKDSTLRAAGLKSTQPNLTLRDLTLTLKVSSSPGISLGDTLIWTLLIANRSRRPLRLAIIPLMVGGSTAAPALSGTGLGALSAASNTRAKTNPTTKGHKHKSTLSTSLFTRPAASTHGPAPARPHSQAQDKQRPSASEGAAPLTSHLPLRPNIHEDEQPTLLPLTADVRIPPLAPGECAEAELRFLTLRAGVSSVEALRVVDLDAVERAESALQNAENKSQDKEEDVRPWTDVPRGMLPDVVIWDAEWRREQQVLNQEVVA